MPEPGSGEAGPELADESMNPVVRSGKRVYEGMVWNVRSEVFEYGDATLTREFVDHPGAVGVLALDDANRVLLIQQYRHPIRARDWELPAGLLDVEGEDALAAAQRELREEAELEAAEWSELVSFHPSPGGSDEAIHVFLARGLSPSGRFERSAEEADIVLRWVPLEDAVQAVLEGRLRNGALAIAVLAAHARNR